MSNQQNDELVESKQDAKNEKLKTYIVRYTFNGFGECETEARNEKEAEENFYDGNFDNDEPDGEDYEIHHITEK